MAQEADQDVAEVERIHVYPNFGRAHEMSSQCWCGPFLEYVDPDTLNEVFVHNVEH